MGTLTKSQRYLIQMEFCVAVCMEMSWKGNVDHMPDLSVDHYFSNRVIDADVDDRTKSMYLNLIWNHFCLCVLSPLPPLCS